MSSASFLMVKIIPINLNVFLLRQMRLPSKPYSSLPIYSIGSTNTLPRERLSAMAAVGHALSVAGGPGQSAVGGNTAPVTLKAAAAAAAEASKGAEKVSRSAVATKSEKSSVSPQRHGIQKTMSK